MKTLLAKLLVALGTTFFSHRTLKAAYQLANGARIPNTTFVQHILSAILKVLGFFLSRDYLKFLYFRSKGQALEIYNADSLHLMVNRVFDLPEVKVKPDMSPAFLVLVPAFSIASISAGFFGVFQVARFLRSQGARVRLILFDNFYYVEHEFRLALKNFPGMEELFEEMEIEYIGERLSPLIISPNDTAVATVWYSAYFARKIHESMGGNRSFLYLIQDYETRFYPANSQYALAEETYNYNYKALVSSWPLLEFMKKERVGRFKQFVEYQDYLHFNNAASCNRYEYKRFISYHKNKHKKKLVIYSRPMVNRNMFELTALALVAAFQKGVFGTGEDWEFWGMGIGSVEIVLSEKKKLMQMPRMLLSEYIEQISSFDIGLSLMASPHPSLIPFDLAGSGALVVTNTFATKTSDYLVSISKNIIAAEPTLVPLVQALEEAVSRVSDLESRYKNSYMNFPMTWEDTWQHDHSKFIAENFKHTLLLNSM
jgi:hypothetical protein